MNNNLHFASVETPAPGENWVKLSETERMALVTRVLAERQPEINRQLAIVGTKPDGQIIVHLLLPLSPGDRGTLLLDLEAFLKESVDQGLTVWLEALGDKNSLRNLRGIEVKAS